jgi:hypothetical protein
LRKYRKNVSYDFSNFAYFGKTNLDPASVDELTKKIKGLYMNSNLISCPDWNFVRRNIEEKVEL